MDGDAQPLRCVAAPLVVSGDAIRVSRRDVLKQVGAHQVSAVVRLAEPRELAVAQSDGLQLGEERGSDFRRRLRRVLGRQRRRIGLTVEALDHVDAGNAEDRTGDNHDERLPASA
jgi:hypothetical protein